MRVLGMKYGIRSHRFERVKRGEERERQNAVEKRERKQSVEEKRERKQNVEEKRESKLEEKDNINNKKNLLLI